MKWQTEVIIFLCCLNLSTGLIVELNAPGTGGVNPSAPESAEDYQEHFNVTEIGEGWKSDRLNIPILGDIYYGFQTFFKLVSYVFVGFPVFLWNLGKDFITDPAGLAAYHAIAAGIGALFVVVMAFYIVWFISGREL